MAKAAPAAVKKEVEELREKLQGILDLKRLASRVTLGVAMPREIDWKDTLEIGIQLQEMLAATGRRMSIVFVTGHRGCSNECASDVIRHRERNDIVGNRSEILSKDLHYRLVPASGQKSICARLAPLGRQNGSPPFMKTNFRIGLPPHVTE